MSTTNAACSKDGPSRFAQQGLDVKKGPAAHFMQSSQSSRGAQPQMSIAGQNYSSFMPPKPVKQSNFEMSVAKASAAPPSMMMNQSRVLAKKENLGGKTQSSLQGAMNITKSQRTSNISMSAGFGPSGARLPQSSKSQPEFTITHNDDANEKPWGFPRQTKITMAGASTADEFVPDMQRRTIMNLVLLGGAAVPIGWLGGGFIYFFVPPSGGGGGGALKARDANGDAVKLANWVKAHQEGDRQLVQGLKGDAHYLISTKDGVEDYALNAVCTHLGCVVPWNRAANKYMCPCHGSQYDNTGKVVRGPAPLSLALAHVEIDDAGDVALTPWTEKDFRTGLDPWWK